jgi:hypothetical protein
MNAKQKQERNDRVLEAAGQLEQIRDIARKELGDDVDADMVHLIFDNMRLNNEMDMGLLESDLRNAAGLAEQLYGSVEGKKTDVIVGVYERCCAKPLDYED